MSSGGVGNKRACLICGAPTNYAHFGIDSCRACAEFYKRTLTTNKNYACRQGNRRCVISKSERFVCRRCRFEKCRELGMSLDDPRKRGKKEKHHDELPLIQDLKGHHDDQPTPSTSSSISSYSSSSSPVKAELREETLLAKIEREHNYSVARRRLCEMTIRPTSLRRHVKVECPGTDDLMLCSWTFLMDCLKLYAGDYIAVASAIFPDFAALTLDDQRIMLQNCAARIYILESHFLTSKMFNTGVGPLYMATLTTCFDRENFKFLIQEENPSKKHSEIVTHIQYYTKRLEKLVWPILEKAKLTDTEFFAVFGLVVWQFDACHPIPDHLVELADKVRASVYADLRRYYTEELKLADFSVRMGNLMTVEHAIQEANSLMAEELQAYNLLDMLHADTSFLQIVMQIKL
ncbi:hypothetical protein PFISCL1PPCAC_12738 [Pristionchus fissidentatus]|uniref:Nuclear receptor n=1 Tax=Pristionchus fissidentatus TaxID=1538716 RepID=A0AAV5VS80_9BILA|nr:hypothetical protein PFISCL1PPCAC_12738 [Pristionchus fissidentatus]